MKIEFKSYEELESFARNMLADEHRRELHHLRNLLDEAKADYAAARKESDRLYQEALNKNSEIYDLQAQVRRLQDEKAGFVLLPKEKLDFEKFVEVLASLGVKIPSNDKTGFVAVCLSNPSEVRGALVTMFPNSRIDQIKFIRTWSGQGLMEAKLFQEGQPLQVHSY